VKRVFRPDRETKKIVRFAIHERALADLKNIVDDGIGIGVLVGQPGTGKTVVAKRLARQYRKHTAVILIDGANQAPHQILATVLGQLQFGVDLQTTSEMLDLLHVVAVHRARMRVAPILIVENLDRMSPDSLRAINTIASFRVNGRLAIRLVLTGRAGTSTVLASAEMANVSRHARPLVKLDGVSRDEARRYLYWRLKDAGETRPERILSREDCDQIYEIAGGLAGQLDDCAIRVAEQEGVSSGPTLIVSHLGRVLAQHPLEAKRILIGRSHLADIVIDDRRAGSFHALLLEHAGRLVVADLKSRNGTYVNSRRVRLAHVENTDVISVVGYRITLMDAPRLEPAGEPLQLLDTAISRSPRRRILDSYDPVSAAGRPSQPSAAPTVRASGRGMDRRGTVVARPREPGLREKL
jgi:type II secretory pathway predicted ATPase ExeA